MTGNATAPGDRQASVRWDDTRMATTYANRAEVSATREAISLLLGVEQARQPGQEAVQVQLSRRVALSPAVAKRLAIALRNAVQAQETGRVGQALESGGADSARNNASGDSREPSGAELRLGKIFSFFRQIGTLDAEIDFEHSFKTVHGELFADRFLLCVDRREVHDSPDERIATICERIGMPSNLLVAFRQRLVDANHVYFGVFESVHPWWLCRVMRDEIVSGRLSGRHRPTRKRNDSSKTTRLLPRYGRPYGATAADPS